MRTKCVPYRRWKLDKLTDLHFSAHLVDMMLEYRAIGTRYISLQQSCSRGNSLLPWCTTPIEAESSLGPDSHHPIISLSGIPSAVIVLRILHPILASTLCAATSSCAVLPPSGVATPCLNASVSWPARVGERHQ